MKILGITDIGNGLHPYVKPDSALLVNDKPFFLPEFSEHILCRLCIVVRVNRLGKCIEERFAHRYYDAWAIGLNMRLDPAFQSGTTIPDLQALGFDNSLVVGRFTESPSIKDADKLLISIDAAIAELSKYVTIRMGDMIAVDIQSEWQALKRDMKYEIYAEDENSTDKTVILSCKIK